MLALLREANAQLSGQELQERLKHASQRHGLATAHRNLRLQQRSGLVRCRKLGLPQLRDGQLKRNSVLENLIDRHHAIADGFALAQLPGVRQQLLLAMPITGAGRDVKPGPPPEI